MRRCKLLVLVGVVCLVSSAALGQTVLLRAPLGNYTEDATYIRNGPYAHHIAFLDGYDIRAFPAEGRGRAPARILFSVKDLVINQRFRGMTYLPSEKAFVFADNNRPDRLLITDHKGKLIEELMLQFPEDDPYRSNRFEGVSYIPLDSPIYPDHLLVMTFCQPGQGPCGGYEDYMQRLLVVQRDGVVVKQIVPILPDDVGEEIGDFWGISYQAPDLLLCSGGPWAWKMDFSGNPVGSSYRSSIDTDGFEAIVQLPNGNVALSNAHGKLLMFDSNLTPLPELDRDYTIGLGIADVMGLAWNSDTNELLVSDPYDTRAVWGIPTSLESKRKVVDLAAVNLGGLAIPPEPSYLNFARFRSMTYLPDMHQIALSYANVAQPGVPARVRVVRFDNTGAVVGYQRMFDWNTPAALWTMSFAYIPAADNDGEAEYVFRSNTLPLRLEMVNSEDGSWDGSIAEFTGLVPAEYFKAAGASSGGFLLMTNDNRAIITDRWGVKLWEFNYREKLGAIDVTDLAYITEGPYAGAFALVMGDSCELVIFRLD